MAPLLTFVAALATLGAASATPLPFARAVATSKVGEHSLRGGRQLQVLLCNSIGCPGGYTPIPDAMNTECIGDTCEVSQCCEAFCSYHACPDGYIPITDAGMIMCDDSGCTTDMCCVNNVVSAPTTSTAQDDDTTTATTDDATSTSTEPLTVSPTGSPITTMFTSTMLSDDTFPTRDDDC